jgi:hypothetical protein
MNKKCAQCGGSVMQNMIKCPDCGSKSFVGADDSSENRFRGNAEREKSSSTDHYSSPSGKTKKLGEQESNNASSRAGSSVRFSSDSSSFLDRSDGGYRKLAWVGYSVSLALSAISFFAGLLDVQPFDSISLLMSAVWIIVVIVIFIRKSEEVAGIGLSHLRNLWTVALGNIVVSVVLFLALFVYIINVNSRDVEPDDLEAALIILVISVPLLLWSLYRLISGMLKLKDGERF